jgi:hypothetical protein
MNKRYIGLLVLVLVLILGALGQNAFAEPPIKPEYNASIEYVTSTVSMYNGDGIVVHVVNDDDLAHYARVVIYMNTGAGAVIVEDTGVIKITPTWEWGLGYTISDSGEYWIRIQASSDVLIPKASFELYQGDRWTPFVSYLPGDFAVFKSTGHGRTRLL